MSLYDSILVPTDGSDGVEQALEHAIDLARNHDATLHTLYVVDRRLYFAAEEEDKEGVRKKLEAEGRESVGQVRELAEEAGLEVVSEIREGYPDRDIIDYADAEDIDVVVMGTHGRSGRDRLAHLGSVTERVVENLHRPVFVVTID
jgi:nucleotide-binding universal stress UspA family protein